MLAWEVILRKKMKIRNASERQEGVWKIVKTARTGYSCKTEIHPRCQIFRASPSLREINHISDTSNIYEKNRSCFLLQISRMYHISQIFHRSESERAVLEGFCMKPTSQPGGIHITPLGGVLPLCTVGTYQLPHS